MMRRVFVTILTLLLPAAAAASEGAPPQGVTAAVERFLADGWNSRALRLLERTVPEEREFAYFHYLYGETLTSVGRHYEAVPHFMLAHVFGTKRSLRERALLARGLAYERAGLHEEAAATLRLFFALYPRSPLLEEAHVAMGRALYGMGRYDDAIGEFDRAPSSPEAMFWKAAALHAKGEVMRANDLFVPLAARYPRYVRQSPALQYVIGENLRAAGRVEDAKIYLSSVAGTAHDARLAARARLSLAHIYRREGDDASALALLREAALSPDADVAARALLLTGLIHMESGRLAEAKLAFERVRALYPFGRPYERASLLLAEAQRREGDWRRSLTTLGGLLLATPPPLEAVEGLWAVMDQLLGRRDEEAVAEVWNRYGSLLLEASDAEKLLAVAHLLKSHGEPFVAICTRLEKRGPEEIRRRCSIELASLFLDVGDTEAAAPYVASLARPRDAEAVLLEARLQMARGRYERAARLLLAHRVDAPLAAALWEELLPRLEERDGADTMRIAQALEPLLSGGNSTLSARLADLLYVDGRWGLAVRFYTMAAASSAADVRTRPRGRGRTPMGDGEWSAYMARRAAASMEGVDEDFQSGAYEKPASALLKRAIQLDERERRLEALMKEEM